ncbi:TA system antitoxin ParD family protein [Tsukamurella hominis]|uniref:TA system antitoxin ParD family protein n=1 Tax=Tsukamurella hominis TaxID=1970232 RepID=UPI0039EB4E76
MPHPTRIADDVFEDARVEAAAEGRSIAEQINYWARVGRNVSAHHTTARSRVEAALAGTLSPDALDEAESRAFNAELKVGIRESLAEIDFGAVLAERGIVTVALDDDGRMVEYHPDGTERLIEDAPRR